MSLPHDREDIVTLDFESYYSTEYSLTRKELNTSGYVWHPDFKAHCIGICDGTKDAVWYGPEDIEKALKKHAVASRPIAAHNTAFDGFILSQIYGVVPPFFYDTMSMAQALHGPSQKVGLTDIAQLYGIGLKTEGLLKTKGLRDLPEEILEILGDYCCNDTELCRDVLAVQLKVFPQKELRLIDWTIRAFCDPKLRLNQALVKEEYDRQVRDRQEKLQAANVEQSTLLSDSKLATALEMLGVEVPLKFSPATGQLVPAFSKQDKVFTDLLEHDDPRVVALVEARLATKSTIGITRAQRFLDIGERNLPVGYKYCGAHTTRFSGANKMNLQNLERGGLLRQAIEAPPGHVIVVCDSAQIEARLNAWCWDQDDMVAAFANGDDIYSLQAGKTYGHPVNKKDHPEKRFVGKVQILGLGYGMGPPKFRDVLGLGLMGPPMEISAEEAVTMVMAYRRSASKIVDGWRKCDDILAEMSLGKGGKWKCFEWERDHIWGPSGLALHYNNLYGREGVRNGIATLEDFTYHSGKNGKRSKIWGGTLTENLIQYLARCVVADQILQVIDAGWHVAGMTHDEIIAIAPKEQADRCLDEITKIMSTTPDYCRGAPLGAEGGYATNYSK